jgi:DNA-binding transcriptional LysR family regulator
VRVYRKDLHGIIKVICMIDPNHLRTLRALADHGTVVAAAETLHLSPSAVSQQLNSLARTTGCTLLEKRGRGVVLTQPAKILLEHADAILERFEQAESDMRSYQQGDAAVLRIGGFSSVLQSFVSEAVSTALHRNPGWSIQIEEVESEESMAMLLDRELDVSVVMIAPNRPLLADRRISLDPLLADTYRAVVPAVHPLGALDELDRLSRLAYEPWVLSRHWTSTHEIVMAACAVAGFQPRAAHNTTDFAASVAMVGHGLGVSVIPMLGLPRIVPDSVKILPIRVDPPTRHIAVAVRSGSAQPGSPLAQFRALLKQTVSYLTEPITLTSAIAAALEDAQAPEHEDGGPGKLDEPAKPIEVRATSPSDTTPDASNSSTPSEPSRAVEAGSASSASEASWPTEAGTASSTPESGRAPEADTVGGVSEPPQVAEIGGPSGADESSRASEVGTSGEESEPGRVVQVAALSDSVEPNDAVEPIPDEPRADEDLPAVEVASNS